MKALWFLFGLVGVGLSGVASSPPEPVRIAYLAGLSGNTALSSQRALRAVRLVAKEYNAKGGINGRPIEILAFDNQNSAANNITLFKQIADAKVVAVTGVHISNDALVAAKLAEAHRIPLVVTSSTHPEVTQNKKYVVRVCFTDDAQGKFLAKFAREKLKANEVAAIVDVSDSFSQKISEIFQREFTSQGGQILASIPIQSNDRSFGQVVTALKGLPKLDLLFIASTSMEASYLLGELFSKNVQLPALGTDAWQGNNVTRVLELLKAKGKPAYYSGHWYDKLNNLQTKKFIKTYKEEYGTSPTPQDGEAALSYDAAHLLFESLKKAKTLQPDDVMAALHSTPWQGATGLISLKNGNDPQKPIYVLKIFEGKVSLVPEAM